MDGQRQTYIPPPLAVDNYPVGKEFQFAQLHILAKILELFLKSLKLGRCCVTRHSGPVSSYLPKGL